MNKTIYKIAKNGSVDEWNIEVRNNVIKVTWGKIDGKKQTKFEIIESGKNIGKSNETSPEEQALFEAKSKISSQYDKGYRDTIELAEAALVSFETKKPMLAHDYTLKNNKSKLNYETGIFTQPKLDGVRMFCKLKDDILTCKSRNNKDFPVNKILWDQIKEFMVDLGTSELDGELYIHKELFENIISVVKKPGGNSLADKIEFHIFDFPSTHRTFYDSFAGVFPVAQYLLGFSKFNRIKLVDTDLVHSEDEARDKMQQYLLDGYEGLMLRNYYSPYEYGARSYGLQKWKEFMTDEFTIVDVVSDKDGHGKYICVIEDGETGFEVTPKATHEFKKSLLVEKEKYIGKQLTVKYQNRTAENIPRFGVGLTIRDYE